MIKRLIKTKRALNLYIFQNSAYLVLCVNNIFATFGLAVVYVHLASYAISLGFRENEAALLFSAMGISNFIGRVVYGFLGHLPCFLTHKPIFWWLLFGGCSHRIHTLRSKLHCSHGLCCRFWILDWLFWNSVTSGMIGYFI